MTLHTTDIPECASAALQAVQCDFQELQGVSDLLFQSIASLVWYAAQKGGHILLTYTGMGHLAKSANRL